ncbi:MAG: hypothetical protein M3Y26_08665, partial [Actinomycetota bacterium]|nr:hypothetical protein [Actinomycetota bacterium]
RQGSSVRPRSAIRVGLDLPAFSRRARSLDDRLPDLATVEQDNVYPDRGRHPGGLDAAIWSADTNPLPVPEGPLQSPTIRTDAPHLGTLRTGGGDRVGRVVDGLQLGDDVIGRSSFPGVVQEDPYASLSPDTQM